MSGKALIKGITKIGPTLSYCLVRPYFGNALNLGLYPTQSTLGCIWIGHKSDSQLVVLLDIVVPWPFQHMSGK